AQGGQPAGRRIPGGAGVVCGAVGWGVVPVAQVLHGGLFRAVGKNDAVGAEGVVGGALAKVAAVAQAAAPGALLPQGLVHVVPYKAALVLGMVQQADVAFHPAQAVAHIVHIFAEDEGLGGTAFEVGADLLGLGVHPAFHVADPVKGAAVEHPFVVDQPAGVVLAEELAHGQDVLAGVGLVAAAPDQDGGVVFVPLEHRAGPVHHARSEERRVG